ncbi:MAG: aldo/keto reductase [Thermodesulfobacteriota bacterium]|nr:aldo/keto reductase [Thermodesulfobacteriota bacterium]
MVISSKSYSRLVLGTAQLGMSYGAANKTGKPGFSEAENIVRNAWRNNIVEFDTAQGYGHSEKTLGDIFENLDIQSDVKVISKIDTALDHSDRAVLRHSITRSLEYLKCTSLYGLMLHKESLLEDWDRGLGAFLDQLIEKGIVQHVGVSVYSTEKAVQALTTEGVTIIQIPANVLDRRFENAGIFELADRLNKTVYVRSIFLQGLLLMDIDKLPAVLKFATPVLQRFKQLSRELRMTRHSIAIGYVKLAYPNAKILFGSETALQVEENTKIWGTDFPNSMVSVIRDTFSNVDEKLVNPSLW